MSVLSLDSTRRLAVIAPGARAWLTAGFWLAAFVFSLLALGFTNDHFGRISPARQIAEYGEMPFRDFLDPGYFLTELASAATQRLLGDNLLGEWLLTSSFVASGAVVVLLLAMRMTRSPVASVIAAVVALLSLPRAYDYDKFLFCPLGLLLCWRYVDRRRPRDLWVLAVGLVVGALFRYDTGVYIACAGIATIVAVHAGQWRVAARRVALFLVAVWCLALPFLLFLSYDAGLANVVDQVVTYGRRETARTRIVEPPRFSSNPAADPGPPGDGVSTSAAVPRSSQARWRAPAWANPASAGAFLYYLLRLLPLAASLVLVVGARSNPPTARSDIARLAGLLVMCVLLNIFILREPVEARVGGMAGPAAVLAAWLGYTAWRSGAGATRHVLRAAVGVLLALTVWSASVALEWQTRLTPEVLRVGRLGDLWTILSASPPSLLTLPNPQLAGMVRYLRECTGPEDRVFAGWFVPELYFFAQRGFAAGIVASFGGHWREPRFQQRSIEALASHPVPILIFETSGYGAFVGDYPILARYLDEHYVIAGHTDFGATGVTADAYTLLVDKERRPTYVHPVTSVPCFW